MVQPRHSCPQGVGAYRVVQLGCRAGPAALSAQHLPPPCPAPQPGAPCQRSRRSASAGTAWGCPCPPRTRASARFSRAHRHHGAQGGAEEPLPLPAVPRAAWPVPFPFPAGPKPRPVPLGCFLPALAEKEQQEPAPPAATAPCQLISSGTPVRDLLEHAPVEDAVRQACACRAGFPAPVWETPLFAAGATAVPQKKGPRPGDTLGLRREESLGAWYSCGPF